MIAMKKIEHAPKCTVCGQFHLMDLQGVRTIREGLVEVTLYCSNTDSTKIVSMDRAPNLREALAHLEGVVQRQTLLIKQAFKNMSELKKIHLQTQKPKSEQRTLTNTAPNDSPNPHNSTL